MLTLKGKPFVKIGSSGGSCDQSELDVPPICSDCRQLKRWTKKILSWAKNSNSKFGAMAKAILQADDDILSSLCGFCYLEENESCECFMVKYQSLGLPLTIPVWTGDVCLPIGNCVTYESCGVEGEWFEICQELCNDCIPRTLDPCNIPADRVVTQSIYDVARLKNRSNRSGASLIEALELLFPNSAPQIVTSGNGIIRVWIGRPMTQEEFQLRQYYKTMLPLNSRVSVVFIAPCQ